MTPTVSQWPSQIALGALSFAACMYMGAQLRLTVADRSVLRSQAVGLEANAQEMRKLLENVEENIQRRTEALGQTQQLESRYAALFTELLELAKTDLDARSLVLKWKIQTESASQRESPATSPQPPPPSPSGNAQSPGPGAPPGETKGKNLTPKQKLGIPAGPSDSAPRQP